MAHNVDIRYRCRAMFEVLDMTLTEIAKKESIGISTLSEWKNDDREEWGGIWIKGIKSGKVGQAKQKLEEELRATSVYDEMKKQVTRHTGVTGDGKIEVGGVAWYRLRERADTSCCRSGHYHARRCAK